MEEVYVYGVKEPLTMQQITSSADIFSEDRLERESLFQLNDVLQRTPNVTGSIATLTIRGIPRGNVAGAGVAPSRGDAATIYIDGAPSSGTALEGNSFISMWDVKQAEVLRGPQSSVQGRNALAGAVFITTNSPSYNWEARARALTAENDTRQYAALLSGPLVRDQLAFRFSVDSQTTDGFVNNALTEDDADTDESLLLRGKFLYEPEAIVGLRTELIYEYTDAEIGEPSAVFGPGAVNDPAVAGFSWRDLDSFNRPQSVDTKTRRAIVNLDYELSESANLRFIGTYEEAESIGLTGDIDNPERFNFNRRDDGSSETYSAELQYLYDFDRWSGLVGLYYYEDSDELDLRGSSLLAGQSPFPVDPEDSQIRFSQVSEGETQNYAIFFNTRYELSEKWTLSAGLRYDNESVDLRSAPVTDLQIIPAECVILFGANQALDCLEAALQFSPPSEDPQQEVEFDAWLPRAAITYHLSSQLSLFVSAQRGYRAGGTYLQNNIVDTIGLTVGEFDPEYLDDYELGFRFLGLDNRLRFNGNLFYSNYKDQQVRVPGPSGESFDEEIVNAARSEIYGLELETNYLLTTQLGLYGSLGLLNAEFRDFPWGEEGTPRENLQGNTMPQAPKVSANAGVSYSHELGVFADASLYYQGPVESDIANLNGSDFGGGFTERTGSLTLANIRLGYRNEHLSLAAYVTNLLDDGTPNNINIGAASRDGVSVSYFSNPRYSVTQPRTVGMVLEVQL
ncbi:MAG: TonB-dependent receptor [Pseudomonadota bacterium]